MKSTFVVVLVTSVAAMASTEEQINKRFSVQPGGTVIVDVGLGSIQVSTSSDQEVVVDVWRKVGRSSKAKEEAYLRDNPIELSQEGANVTVRCRDKVSHGSSWSWFGGRNRNDAKYTITVPSKFNSKLKTAGGDINVKDLTGDTRAKTSGGGLRFEHLHGGVDGGTSGGGVHVRDSEGTIKVRTSGGGIDVVKSAGSLDADTSGGPITVKGFSGPTKVNTSGGGLSLENLSGEVHGSTSGGSIHAALAGPLGETTKLSTSGGGITIRIPENAAFDLDAATSGGNVRSDFPIDSSHGHKHRHLKGAVNGGGKLVFLRTSGGSIRVNKL